jgi:hypothetical protein
VIVREKIFESQIIEHVFGSMKNMIAIKSVKVTYA